MFEIREMIFRAVVNPTADPSKTTGSDDKKDSKAKSDDCGCCDDDNMKKKFEEFMKSQNNINERS